MGSGVTEGVSIYLTMLNNELFADLGVNSSPSIGVILNNGARCYENYGAIFIGEVAISPNGLTCYDLALSSIIGERSCSLSLF